MQIGNAIYEGCYGKGPKGEFREQTTEVGIFPPNAFGLHDMHGNVWEWCADTLHNSYQNAPIDDTPWYDNNNHYHILRGGSWFEEPIFCRCAHRNWRSPGEGSINYGFRVACSLFPIPNP